MVKFLQNPANDVPDDAIVHFSTEDDSIFRLRFNSTGGTSGPTSTRLSCAALLQPFTLNDPLFSRYVSSDTSTSDLALMYPTGPNPSDATNVNKRTCLDVNPKNHDAYVSLYSRYFVNWAQYIFEIYNYEDFPIVFGYCIQPTAIVYGVDSGGARLFESMVDFGMEAAWDPRDLRYDELRRKENVVLGRIPAAQGSARLAGTVGQGAGASDAALHVTPGKGIVKFTVSQLDLLKQMLKVTRHEDYDVDVYSGVYAAAVLDPDWIAGSIGVDTGPCKVWIFACSEQAFHTDFQGTAAADDHFAGLHIENWSGGNADGWTGKIVVKPMVRQNVRLFDPIVRDQPSATDPDVIMTA